MPYLMGIDLGTSSVRAMIIRENGDIVATEGESYDVNIPQPRHAEQDPHMWWEKASRVIGRAVDASGIDPEDIAALSFSGQMHGLVCLDAKGDPVRPAIIWPDQRSAESIEKMVGICGRERLVDNVQNAVATGFLLASLYWLRDHEPESYRRTKWVMLPKDYIKYRLSGKVLTDYSDAAGSTAFDNVNLHWAWDLLDCLDLDRDKFPPCGPSTELAGNVTAEASQATGLSRKTWVVNGGADQAMQAIGNGIVKDGVFASNIGTGGQVSTSMSRPVFDPLLRTSSFAHALPDRWYVMGAVLSSGLSLKWLAGNILGGADFGTLSEEAAKVPPGSGGLLFLPYLTGERTPHLDPDARAVFFGLTLGHDRSHMVRAVMEGVVYAFRDCLEVILEMGLPCKRMIASGGGANSPLWLQIQADILGHDVHRSLVKEQACLGAAITAGVGTGLYPGFTEACAELVKFDDKVYRPIAANAPRYREGYQVYREIYRLDKGLFKTLAGMG